MRQAQKSSIKVMLKINLASEESIEEIEKN